MTHREEPRGRRSPLRVAAAWADDYRYTLGVQLRSRLAPEPPADYLRGDRSPVLLLPGIYESWYYLEPLARRLHELGHPVIAVPELGRNVTTLRESSAIVAERLRLAGTSELVILAHSKGGLIGKALMLGPVAEHVRGMVAINTPFAGSSHARWFPGRSVRALSDRDHHLLRLSDRRDVNRRIVSIYPAFDPHVPGGSFLEGARNVRVDVVGHFRIIEHPEVRQAALDAVAAFSR
ncbi:esterase/lipase family protein [Salana multivorans]